MATAVFRPLTARDRMQSRWTDGTSMKSVAQGFIQPNDRLSSFERLEIYNRVYWFRVLDCLYDDYPGLRAIVGEKKFMKLATAYLAKYPSASFTLRNLGQRLEKFLREEPKWIAPNEELALDMARFEWAQVVAFDDAARPKLTTDDVLDTPPAKLRFALQPYLSLLELNFAVDKFFLAIKKREGDVLRDEASNTFESMPQAPVRKRRPRLPKRERVHLVVHRYDNMLYYKRLEPEAFAILRGLQKGITVERACVAALAQSIRTDVDWSKQIQEWFHDWSALGWFCRPDK
ncbi:MAG: putative DNA-binding domain-containing protein [Chthoniobacterales bacterium]|nr:putative DNA-binding domain-containing protein [Chthoniobacterales bacterium]